MELRGNYRIAAMPTFTIAAFHGINRSMPEEYAWFNMNQAKKGASIGECYTQKGKNFWIDNGVLTVRNNYVELFDDPITVGSYTCYVKSAHVFCSKADDATPLWLLGCDMQTGTPLSHHHYALVYGALDGSSWAECITANDSIFGNDKSLYFTNANFSFCNFTGNYTGNYTDDSVTVCTNGVDIPVAFLPYADLAADVGLYEVKSPGWVDVTPDYTTNTFTDEGYENSVTDLAYSKNRIKFISRTGALPTGISADILYYVLHAAPGDEFQVSLTDGGTAVAFTNNGENVMARLCATDPVSTTVSSSTNRLTIASGSWPKLKNGDRVEFSAADPDYFPDEIAANTIYFVRDVSKYTFKITDAPGNTAYTFAANDTSGNLKVYRIANTWEDCPKGELVFEHDQRLWMKIGNTIYHSDNFYQTNDWEYAHSRDWSVVVPNLRTGAISILTFDGDTIKAVHQYGPEKIVHKENTFWRIANHVPPYSAICVFSVKGTIAPRSVCQWRGNLIYAVADGLEIYNGASAGPLLRDEIKGIWSSDNEDCICAVAGDVLYVYASLIDPTDAEATAAPAILAIDLATKNICYWTLDIDGETALDTINAVVNPVYTTLLGISDEPLFMLAANSQFYYVDTDAPSDSEAVDMEYWIPQNTFGDIINRKTLGRMAVYGSAPASDDVTPVPGKIVYTPYIGTTEKSAKTISLPTAPGAARPVQLSLSNAISAGAKIENSTGDVPRIHSIQTEVTI